ncbi:hypothetical protein [Streptomyces sp. NPDC004285]
MIHVEAWAGTPAAPHRWLLTRDTTPTPWGAVRRLTAIAEWLADRLDDDPDDDRPYPGATLRIWLEDRGGHENIAHRLAGRGHVPQAVRVTGPGHVLYSLAAMPAAICVCLPRPLTLAAVQPAVLPATSSGWPA